MHALSRRANSVNAKGMTYALLWVGKQCTDLHWDRSSNKVACKVMYAWTSLSALIPHSQKRKKG